MIPRCTTKNAGVDKTSVAWQGWSTSPTASRRRDAVDTETMLCQPRRADAARGVVCGQEGGWKKEGR